MLGVKMTSIAYKGATQALTDIAGGQVDWMITSPAAAKTLIQGGKVKLLATTGLKRDPLNPQIPTVAEALPGFEITQWWGVMLPSKTPQKIVDRIHKELVATLQEPAIQKQLLAQGGVAMPLQEKEFAEFIVKERQKYAQLIRSANITPEN
jgi:tripartite-type tricarboxylate transporter receptor subunit TctC